MKKWVEFFFLSFFSHGKAKEGARRGYTNVLLSLTLSLVFMWSAFVGGDMLPFGVHYDGATDFGEAAGAVLANADSAKRLYGRIEKGSLRLKKQGGEYTEALFVNTFERVEDRQNYSVGGYGVIVDTRPAGTPAEVEAYCLSNDGKGTEISYEEYLALSEVARLNFDFKLRYTGEALELSDGRITEYRAYLDTLGEEMREKTAGLDKELGEGSITEAQYGRGLYELYFTSYYPKISDYESTSAVPLLRNYYYHEYISKGIKNYLFIFDDYMTGSFEAGGGAEISFFGFYSSLEEGELVREGADEEEAREAVDGFIMDCFRENWFLNAYGHLVNTITLTPFIALMIMVAALLTYSVLRLRGVESVGSLGAMIRIVGSFSWFSGLISALITVIAMFFVNQKLLIALPPVLFFVALVIRSVIFAITEDKLYIRPSESQTAEQTEE